MFTCHVKAKGPVFGPLRPLFHRQSAAPSFNRFSKRAQVVAFILCPPCSEGTTVKRRDHV